MITPDHEILTQQNGWQPVLNCDPLDKIATLNTTTNKLEYQACESWSTTEVTDSDLFVLRHNRAELTCLPSTKIMGRFSKTSAWQKLVLNNVKSLEFSLRLYLGDVVVKPINMKVLPATYTGTVHSPVAANGVYLVKKNDKIFWVCC